MNLTKGQKDALARRAQKIIDEKFNAKAEEVKKNWVPTPEEHEYLNNVKTVVVMFNEVKEFASKVGFSTCYGGINTNSKIDNRTLYFQENNTFEDTCDWLCKKWINSQLKDTKYPTWEEVVDEVELLTMSKDFDVDAFLEKYKNL